MRRSSVSLISFLVVLIHRSLCLGSCGSANCPIDTRTTETSERGVLRLDYSFEYINQDTPRAGRDKVAVGEIPGDHNEIYTVNRTHRIGFEYGFTDRLSALISVPFIDRSHQHFDTEDGELRTWSLSGLGDIGILSRFTFINPAETDRPLISALLGAKFPTGKTRLANDQGQEAEVGVQPGSGAYSLIVGASWLKNLPAMTASGLHANMPIFMSTTYQWNGKGTDDYKLGDVWTTNVGLTYPMFSKLALTGQVNMKITGRDGRGNTDQQVDRTGGTFVYLSPGLQFGITGNTWSYVYMQLPIYQRVNVIQLTADYNLVAGISAKFNVRKKS